MTKAAADCFTARRRKDTTHRSASAECPCQSVNASALLLRVIVKNAPVLLLDKATSARDAESERLGRQALDRVADQRTTIVIAHWLATVQNGGPYCRHGKRPHRRTGLHWDLAQGIGLYARFAALQFSRRH